MKRYEPWFLTLISGFAVYLFDKLFGQQIAWDKIKQVPVLKWLTIEFKLYQGLIFIFVFGLFFLILKRSKKSSDSYYAKKQKKLKEFSQTIIGGILWKWDVHFDYAGKPWISDLTPYCIEHGSPPLKTNREYYGYKCIIPQCNRSIGTSTHSAPNVSGIENLIQSQLEEHWEKIQK